MNPARLTLNNPAFQGRLRHISRDSAYVPRPTPRPSKLIIQDIAAGVRPRLAAQTHDDVSFRAVALSQPAKLVESVKSQSSQHPVVPLTAHAPTKSSVLLRTAVQRPDQKVANHKAKKGTNKTTLALYGMAATLFVLGLAVSLNGLLANHKVAAQVKQLSAQNTGATHKNTPPPDTAKPAAASIASYTVAPNMPRYIDIPKLSVHARIKSMGVNSKNQLQAPGNVYDAGWYNGSAQPGQPGGMLVDGHISSWTTKGVFYGLNKLVTGDDITITRGDNKTFTYKIVKTETVSADAVDMASLLVSQDTAKPGLNLISCSGDVIPGTNEFDKRIIVYAVQG